MITNNRTITRVVLAAVVLTLTAGHITAPDRGLAQQATWEDFDNFMEGKDSDKDKKTDKGKNDKKPQNGKDDKPARNNDQDDNNKKPQNNDQDKTPKKNKNEDQNEVIVYGRDRCGLTSGMIRKLKRADIAHTYYNIDKKKSKSREMWRTLHKQKPNHSGSVRLPIMLIKGKIHISPRFSKVKKILGR